MTYYRGISLRHSRNTRQKTSENCCYNRRQRLVRSIHSRRTSCWSRSTFILLPYICAMCNASLREGSLPATQKMAIITPVVKKAGLVPEEPQNYRPISNLTFISKAIERIVANQIKAHLADNDLMPSVQSAYRQGGGHSTIIDAADSQEVRCLPVSPKPDSPKLGFRVRVRVRVRLSVSANRVSANRD